MAGPLLQMPAAASQVFDFSRDSKGQVITISMKPEWAAFFQSLQELTFAATRNGSTSMRPTSSFAQRFEGMPFLDRTLGQPIWLKHASSNVWIDATGGIV